MPGTVLEKEVPGLLYLLRLIPMDFWLGTINIYQVYILCFLI